MSGALTLRSTIVVASVLLGGCLLPDSRSTQRYASNADMGTGGTPATPDAAPTADSTAPASDAAAPGTDAHAAADAGPSTDAVAPPGPDASCGEPPFDPQVGKVCPGAAGCELGGTGNLQVGAAKEQITDIGFELPKVEFLETFDRCNESQGGGPGHCGVLDANFMRNCGTDRLCPGDDGYVAPDADGTEDDTDADGNPIWDYYRDCGIDNLCPGDPGYTAPDEGEGNGRFDGLWIAGFGTNRPALGVRDPLWARTIAVQQGDTVVTMTAIDAVGIFYDDVKRIRERAVELLAQDHPEIDVDYMFVSATHDHESPDTMGQWGGEVDPEIDIPTHTGVSTRYIEHLREKAARSIVEAVTSMQPATMHVAEARTGADGFIRDSRDPMVINDIMGVLRFTDASDHTIATLATWGNHPEAMSDVNNFLTSDFVNGIRDGLESGIPDSIATHARPGEDGIAVFMQGTVGGLMTPLGVDVPDLQGNVVTNYTFLRADIMGWRLAGYALDALAGAETVENPALSFATSEFVIPVDNRVFHVGMLVNLFNRETPYFDPTRPIDACNRPYVRTQMAMIRLGPVSFYSLPGELFPELALGFDPQWAFGRPQIHADNPNPPDLSTAPAGPYFSGMMPGQYHWPLGLGNDEVGYLVPEYDYKTDPTAPFFVEAPGDHYEETNSLGPQAVPRVRIVLDRLLQAVAP